jgi:RNase P protein component
MRSALYSIESQGRLKQGFLVVIAARSAMPELKADEVERQLNFAFTKLGMYKN